MTLNFQIKLHNVNAKLWNASEHNMGISAMGDTPAEAMQACVDAILTHPPFIYETGARTPEQAAADRRALYAAAPTPADRFALMFGWPPYDKLPIHQNAMQYQITDEERARLTKARADGWMDIDKFPGEDWSGVHNSQGMPGRCTLPTYEQANEDQQKHPGEVG